MANIHLHSGSASSVTCVSNYFIDHCLGSISGDAVRVYLTLLRCLGDRDMEFCISGVADRLSVSAREVRTALDELSAAGIVALDYDSEGELCDICLISPDGAEHEVAPARVTDEEPVVEQPVRQNNAAVAQPQSVSADIAQPQTVGAETAEPEVPEMIDRTGDEQDEEVRTTIFIAERYLGRTLSPMDLKTVLYWYYDLHMDADMIDCLITSNLENGKTSLSYMNKVAIAWWKKGIHTTDQANLEQKQFSTETNTVRRAFGITGHVMTPAELDYINRWFHEWGFAPELVQLACERTITSIGNPSYKYAESILSSWHEKGFTTIEQIEEDDNAHSRQEKQRYQGRGRSAKSSGGFGFSETNKYDDNAIASVLLKHNTF